MRQQHRLTRAFALTATVATLAMALAPAFGAQVSFAKTETKVASYYEDSQNNLCVGLPTETLFAGSCQWEGVTGEANVAIGWRALKSDTTGCCNVASGFGALSSNTTGRFNVASGWGALVSNTEGEQKRRERHRRAVL